MKRFAFVFLTAMLLFSLVGCMAAPAEPTAAAPESAAPIETAAPTETAQPVSEEVEAEFSPDFTFTVTDAEGIEWNESVFADHELTMINFWEPWCGPCVSEMPDLQSLYENYSDRGFIIIGVYSTADGVEQVLADCGIGYPILPYVSEFDQFQTGYVPNTIFVDGDGHVVWGPQAGSASYEDWAAIVEELLA